MEAWRKLLADRWAESRQTLDEIAAKSGLNRVTIHRIFDGTTAEPGFESVAAIARALSVPLGHLSPRPEGEGRHEQSESDSMASALRRLAITIDREYEGADSWRGDVQKAIAALARALGRETATVEPPAKTQKAR